MSADYITLFDATKDLPPNLGFFAVSAALPLFAALIMFANRQRLWWALPLIAVGILAFYGLSIVVPFYKMRSEVLSGQCKSVEGLVENFAGEPKDGKGPRESFEVGGTRFEYGNFSLRPGYHRSVSNGGISLAGEYVRICSIDGEIAQIWVKGLP